MYKFIVIDLDGTLLNDNKEIGMLAKKEIVRLRNENMHFIIASGRHFLDVKRYSIEIEMDESDYIITCDGQYIYNGRGRLLWRNCFLSTYDAKKIMEITRVRNALIFTDQIDYVICNNSLKKIIRKAYNLIKRRKNIMVYSQVDEVDRKIEKVRLKLSDIQNMSYDFELSEYNAHKVFEEWLDITNIKVNKYEALIKLSEIAKIEIDSILYFGDDYNDIECFNNLRNCIAMGSAPQTIKDKAFYVTKNSNKDGVGIVLSAMKNGTLIL